MTGPVRLALDLQALQVDGYAQRGIGRYVAGSAVALWRAGRVERALLAPELPPPAGLPPELGTSGLVAWDCAALSRAVTGAGGPVVRHVPAPFLHSGPRDPSGLVAAAHWADCGVPRTVTLHDLIPLRAPRRYLPTPAHVERFEARARWVASADLVFTNSEHTRRDAIELLEVERDRVVTVGAGVSPFFTPHDGTDEELFVFHLAAVAGRPFVLVPGGDDARKGVERAIAAAGLLVQAGFDLQLVVAGELTGPWLAAARDAARSAGIDERVHVTGFVRDELLRACYRRAALTVMPSLAEGFGLPMLESAACGTPALGSTGTALAEVAGSDLALVDPADTEAIAQGIASLLVDDGRRATVLAAQQAIASSSTWEAVALRMGAALDDLAGTMADHDWGRPPARRRLALAGPLPPTVGGMAAYNHALLVALGGRVALDAVTPMLTRPATDPGVGHVPADAFGVDARPASYDAVVYTLGNSDGHLPVAELALRYPGWLWLHETRLAGIASTALAAVDDDAYTAALDWLLERTYPGRAPRSAARRAGRSVLELVDAGVGLLPLLASCARGLLVNSDVARRLVELDLTPLACAPPIVVLPPACPPPQPRPRVSTDEPLVASFGIVSMAKCPEVLVDAAAVGGFRLVFVGECPPILAEVVGDRARARGIADRVEVTGGVDAAQWRSWLERAAVAVQLRRTMSGEMSASVLEALSAGVPVATNMATAAEYGEQTVTVLPSLEAHDVGARIRTLLDSPGRRTELSDMGIAFAAEHSFDRLADALLAAVTG